MAEYYMVTVFVNGDPLVVTGERKLPHEGVEVVTRVHQLDGPCVETRAKL